MSKHLFWHQHLVCHCLYYCLASKTQATTCTKFQQDYNTVFKVSTNIWKQLSTCPFLGWG